MRSVVLLGLLAGATAFTGPSPIGKWRYPARLPVRVQVHAAGSRRTVPSPLTAAYFRHFFWWWTSGAG